MENVLLTYRIERNKKFNRLAKWGYFAAATLDPYGTVSLIFAIILKFKGAGNKQISGFIVNMVIHTIAGYIFNTYYDNLTGTIIYSIVFATLIPILLYRLTALPTTELMLAELAKS